MAIPITPITAPQQIQSPLSAGRASQGLGGVAESFRDTLDKVNAVQQQAHVSAGQFLAGESVDVHKVVLDQQRSQIAFDLLLQVRNKAVQAYQEVMRMQI